MKIGNLTTDTAAAIFNHDHIFAIEFIVRGTAHFEYHVQFSDDSPIYLSAQIFPYNTCKRTVLSSDAQQYAVSCL